ncbi:serine/threonine protein kinase [Myxococcota bacterium]|nr:serine/threonine protein kinase [Myxococcota bacterium]MBU1430202.1 serine/threonine protein kinase [Myxococcota bacterium]
MSAPLLEAFHALSPQAVIDAVEVGGRRCTGRAHILNSYENRVYQLELESGEWVVGKFYRPGRWPREAILEEHALLKALEEADLPVLAPLPLDEAGETLGVLTGEAAGIPFAIFPKGEGRIPQDDFTLPQLAALGRTLGEIHAIASELTFQHRPTLSPQTYGRDNLALLLEHRLIPEEARARYVDVVERILKEIEPRFEGVELTPVHADCHRANLLLGARGFTLLDFDDLRLAPAVQDLWLLVPGEDEDAARARNAMVLAYQQHHPFDPAWLQLIEPLRALRIIHYATWIARRFEDPTFKRTFDDFGTVRYWLQEAADLEAQLRRIKGA